MLFRSVRQSANTFLGICRSLWAWGTLGGLQLYGLGTNLKFYIGSGAQYYDITPLVTTNLLGNNPFATDTATNTGTQTTVTVTDSIGGFSVGSYVTFNKSVTVNGVTISGNYLIQTEPTGTTYTITVTGTATSTGSGGGTGNYAAYEIDTGPEYAVPLTGWGAGTWGSGVWGTSSPSTDSLRLWSQYNFGEDLVFGPRGGGIYYWNATIGYEIGRAHV